MARPLYKAEAERLKSEIAQLAAERDQYKALHEAARRVIEDLMKIIKPTFIVDSEGNTKICRSGGESA